MTLMSAMSEQKDTKAGLIFAISGYCMWGLTPIFWHALTGVDALEITAQRMLWCVVFMGLAVLWMGKMREALALLKNRKQVFTLLLTAILITTNWGVMVWCVVHGQVMQASLGYYLNTLVTVALGVLLFKESASPLRYLAFAFGLLAFAVQVVGLGQLPWAAPVLALSFGFYGYFRKKVPVGALEGLFVEALLLLPLTLGYVLYLAITGTGAFLNVSPNTDMLLVLSGPLSALPLALFAASVSRARLSTLGFLQYIGPSIQLVLAVFLFLEPFTRVQAIIFACVWTALALLALDGVYAHVSRRRARAKA